MKKYIKYYLFGIFLLPLMFVSCDTAEQDVEDIISPDNKPMVTVTASKTATTLNEGETITYTISFDRTIDRAVTFTPVVTGTADDHDFDHLDPITIDPYTKSAQFTVVTLEDIDNEATETINIQLEVQGIAEKYLLHPTTVLAPINLSIKDAGMLKIVFGWAAPNADNDYDMVTWDATGATPKELGDAGASLGNPETDRSIMLTGTVGTYYVNVMEWGYGVDFNYTFTITHPNNTVQTITGVLTGTNLSSYTNDAWKAWGGSYSSYRVLKVVNNGTIFVVTKL